MCSGYAPGAGDLAAAAPTQETDTADAALADVALADAAPALASATTSRVGRVRTKRKGAFDPSEEAKKPQHEK